MTRSRTDLDRLRPMLAVAVPPASVATAHAYEFKWDGVRALVHTAGGSTVVRARSGAEVTHRYPELWPLADRLDREAVLDGEIVALDAEGRPSFERLQTRMHLAGAASVAAAAARTPVALLVFDVLALDGDLLLDRPYEARREVLAGLGLADAAWQVPPAGDDLATMLRIAGERGLEGVVAKRLGSPYRPGERSRDWGKLALRRRQEVVVGGWRPGRGSWAGSIGSLLVGVHDDHGRLRYAGAVGSGLRDRDLRDLAALLVEVDASPFADPVPHRDARFVRPDVIVDVRFREWTADGRLRQPVYLGRRDDLAAADVRREPQVP